jgi:hypothetical protein
MQTVSKPQPPDPLHLIFYVDPLKPHINNLYAFSPVDLLSVYFCSPYVTKNLHPSPPITPFSDQMQHTATQGPAHLDVCTEKKETWQVLSTLSTQAHLAP